MKEKAADAMLMLGGNIDDSRKIFEIAISNIKEKAGAIVTNSSLYLSEPWGGIIQSKFVNQAVWIKTDFPPSQLLEILLNIEKELGRTRLLKNGPRTLDIDIIFYNDLIFNDINLQIPHPRMHSRRFNLVPVAEIAPNWKHPVLMKTVSDLLDNCVDNLNVKLLITK